MLLKRYFTIAAGIILFVSGSIFPMDFTWEVITNLNDARQFQIENDTLFAATSGGLLVYSLADRNYQSWNSGNGLTDHNFTAITLSKNSIILGTQDGVLSFFNRRTWDFSEDFSLEGNEITGLLQVKDTLWVASKKLIAVYLFDSQKQQYQFRDFFDNFSLPVKEFRDLYYFRNRIWVASDGGLFSAPANFLEFNLKSADSWTYLSTEEGLATNNIYSLSALEDTLLIGTSAGLVKYSEGIFRQVNQGLANQPLEHILVKNQTIFVNNSKHIYQLSGKRFDEKARILQNSIVDFDLDDSQNIWLALHENGYKNMSGDEHLRFNGPIDNAPGESLLDSKGRLWVLSGVFNDQRAKGFSVLQNDGIWKNFRYIKDWYPAASAQTILEDAGGNIWIGSWNGGMTIIDQNFDFHHFNNFATPGFLWVSSTTMDDTIEYSPPDSIHHLLSYTRNAPDLLVITDILLDSLRQSIWMLALTVQSGKPIVQYHGTDFTRAAYNPDNWTLREIPDQFAVTNDQVAVITTDIFNNLWIGTENSGVVILQIDENGKVNWSDLKESDNLKNPKCWALAGDQDGYVWIGTHGGLNAFFNGQVFDFREDYQPIGLRINKIVVDSENNKWFATDKGLSLLRASGSPWDARSWEHFVPGNSELFGDNIHHTNLPSEDIRSVFVDNSTGDIYCSTMSGLAILRSNPFTTPLPKLNKIKTGPNPFIIGDRQNAQFYFRNLTRNSQIKILTTSGQLVRTLNGGFGSEILGSFAQWDGRNQAGRLVSSGVYLYLVMDESGNSTSGKIVIIRK